MSAEGDRWELRDSLQTPPLTLKNTEIRTMGELGFLNGTARGALGSASRGPAGNPWRATHRGFRPGLLGPLDSSKSALAGGQSDLFLAGHRRSLNSAILITLTVASEAH